MREIVWLIVVVLFFYVLYQLYRASRLEQGKVPGRAEPATAAPEPTDKRVATDTFQLELEVQQLRRDVAQLRLEQDEQRRHALAMEERLEAIKSQLESALMAPGTAPEYSEALVFARRGLDVDTIAERCGISVSEAELVRSLAQRGGEPDEERSR